MVRVVSAVFALAALAGGCGGGERSRDAAVDASDGSAGDAGPRGGPCDTDRDCSDLLVCTIDHCEAGACTHEPCADCCPDDLVCDVERGCEPAPEPCTVDGECRDSIPCTLDRCVDEAFCEHLPQNALCSGGQSCFPALGCIESPPETCETAEDCTRGRFCLGDWSCQPEFGCQFLAGPDCDDGDECTDDGCDDAMGGCTHTPRDVDGDGFADDACGGDDCDDSDPERHPDAEEVCDGDDDDCDGSVDEGCCTPDEPCETECGSSGRTACDGAMSTCVPPMETCNGDDDDCDGEADEGFDCRLGDDEACSTSCDTTGERTCEGECTWSACGAPAEACNGDDDDCDGEADEGFACERGTTGACRTSCGSDGTRLCLGDCTYDDCMPPMEVCNGRDDDCDGDEDEGCCEGDVPCTTSCGSLGTTVCDAGGMVRCEPPAEICNGRDDDCDTDIDEGAAFACVLGRERSCSTTCGSTGSQTCEPGCRWGACTPPMEVCNGRDDDCNDGADEGFACVAGSTSSCTTTCFSTGSRLCLGDCTFDVCVPPAEVCNGVDDDCDTVCDDGFTCCRGSTVACSTLGFFAGTATCRSTCAGYNTSGCTNCGNGRRDSGEQCDGSDLGGANCTTLGMGFTGGTLRCGSGCTYDTSGCTTTTGFDPSGSWSISPTASYMCAYSSLLMTYLVQYSVSTLTFTDTGSELRVAGWSCSTGFLTGPSARSSRAINVTCTNNGCPFGCTETYTIVGTFTDDDTWTGTMRVSFMSCGGSCSDCTTQTHSVTGTRL